jgi:hypothetical protein
MDSEDFAILFHNNAYAYFGMPRRLITDQGPQFVSKFFKALYKLKGIEGNPSTAYHPQTNGQTALRGSHCHSASLPWPEASLTPGFKILYHHWARPMH